MEKYKNNKVLENNNSNATIHQSSDEHQKRIQKKEKIKEKLGIAFGIFMILLITLIGYDPIGYVYKLLTHIFISILEFFANLF